MKLRVLLCLLLLSLIAVPHSAEGEDGGQIRQAFGRMYDLDFAGAHRDIDAWQKVHPEDPMGPAAHAAAFLFTEFDRLGILETQLFTDDDRFEHRKKPSPDPEIEKQFQQAVDATDDLARKALAKNAHDINAQFAQVLSLGLRSDYAALIDKRDLAAIRYTKQSRLLAEQLLQEAPERYDAYLAVGIENYLSGIKPAPVRWLLQMGGVQTDKAQGLHDLRLTAAHGDLLAPFARLLLAVAALRDRDTGQACSLLGGLAAEFPQNPLYRRELQRSRCSG
ncbi:hypothetical protein [Paracidobacterium acidisoli]|uniref:DUF4034 domain-containing protein n=1 Tax=Paracidobacterium acidisoli TaxID=2303751 RepID=A0A372IVX1_9BACT|nr:hypothetical protein [Paracidobacterium acidisoli]MBT9329995.1 hypothetical protein [Paracidobacterium acidisoli]